MDSNDILLINRDNQYCKQIVPVLQEAGYAVHQAVALRNALSLISDNDVGLIICDKDLEDISGYEFLSFLKKDPLRENIPVVFLVPQNNQMRPKKLFDLGAVDYLVYPLGAEVLLDRLKEVFPPSAGPEPSENQGVVVPPEAVSVVEEDAPSPLPASLSSLHIESSRDGVIWLPTRLNGFSDCNLAVETSLFGKKGVSLMVRFRHPEGVFVVNGRIDTIVFKDFQKPADIDIAVDDDETWRRIYAWLVQIRDGKIVEQPDETPEEPSEEPAVGNNAATIVLNDPSEESTGICFEELHEKASANKQSYDLRFYNSIIGKQLDNYRVISLIGAGSMGGVLQGWDVALEREVALKIISFELSSKEEFREMFIKEARVVSKLSHPNIALIYNIGLSNDILYYAMEFIDGVTLKDFINKKRKVNLLKGLAILITVCRALDVVYQHSIVHRDIKPANIMITHGGMVKLVDFGVAHSKDFKPAGKKLVFGTPLYMSPEQIVGLVLDHRSDIYSLGATFYHFLCGCPPFQAKEIKDILDQHLNASVPPLSDKDSGIPPDISDVIEKMMAKDPNERYQSFKTIIDKLVPLRSRLIAAEKSGGQGR